MSVLSIESKLRVTDRMDLRDVLRDTITAADAEFAALSMKDVRVEFAGNADFAPVHELFATRGIPELLRARLDSRGEAAAAMVQVRLDRWHTPLTLSLIDYDARDVEAVDALNHANRRIERILAAVADRRA